MQKLSFFLTQKPQEQYSSFEVMSLDGDINIEEWGFLSDYEVEEAFAIDIIQKGEGDRTHIEGKLSKNDITHSYFFIHKDRIAVQMSKFFEKKYDMVVCMASREIVASTRVFKSK